MTNRHGNGSDYIKWGPAVLGERQVMEYNQALTEDYFIKDLNKIKNNSRFKDVVCKVDYNRLTNKNKHHLPVGVVHELRE